MTNPNQPPQFPGQPAPQQGAYPPPAAKPKKPIFKKWWFWVIIVVVLVGIGSQLGGGSKSPGQSGSAAKPDAPKAEAAKIGTPVPAGDLELTVTASSSAKKLTSPLGNKDGNWILVSVTIKNNGKNPVTLNSSQFSIVEADGSKYETDADNLTYLDTDKNLFLKKLNPKMSTSGQLLFAVPESAKDFTLTFKEGMFGGKEAKVKLVK